MYGEKPADKSFKKHKNVIISYLNKANVNCPSCVIKFKYDFFFHLLGKSSYFLLSTSDCDTWTQNSRRFRFQRKALTKENKIEFISAKNIKLIWKKILTPKRNTLFYQSTVLLCVVREKSYIFVCEVSHHTTNRKLGRPWNGIFSIYVLANGTCTENHQSEHVAIETNYICFAYSSRCLFVYMKILLNPGMYT